MTGEGDVAEVFDAIQNEFVASGGAIDGSHVTGPATAREALERGLLSFVKTPAVRVSIYDKLQAIDRSTMSAAGLAVIDAQLATPGAAERADLWHCPMVGEQELAWAMLVHMRSVDAAPVLRELLKDDRRAVRGFAARHLAWLGVESVAGDIERLLRDADPLVVKLTVLEQFHCTHSGYPQ